MTAIELPYAPIDDFVSSCCVIGKRTRLIHLYDCYQMYSKIHFCQPYSKLVFAEDLSKRYPTVNNRNGIVAFKDVSISQDKENLLLEQYSKFMDITPDDKAYILDEMQDSSARSILEVALSPNHRLQLNMLIDAILLQQERRTPRHELIANAISGIYDKLVKHDHDETLEQALSGIREAIDGLEQLLW